MKMIEKYEKKKVFDCHYDGQIQSYYELLHKV